MKGLMKGVLFLLAALSLFVSSELSAARYFCVQGFEATFNKLDEANGSVTLGLNGIKIRLRNHRALPLYFTLTNLSHGPVKKVSEINIWYKREYAAIHISHVGISAGHQPLWGQNFSVPPIANTDQYGYERLTIKPRNMVDSFTYGLQVVVQNNSPRENQFLVIEISKICAKYGK